ncbi:MAG: hypothetical protein V1722_01315 [Candidatus Micrarchaeota archaeon]
MLLKLGNLREFAAQIKSLPPEKRKVVILAGRHLNEGTRNLAVRHHMEWEKHGVVTALIPAAWTPHGFWHELKPSRATVSEQNQKAKQIPSDWKIARYLKRAGITAQVITFHGTSVSQAFLRNPAAPKLRIIVNNRVPPRLYNAIKRVGGAGVELVLSTQKWTGDNILVEHYFAGKRQKQAFRIPDIFFPNTQVHPNYLEKPLVTRKELARFDRRLHSALLRTIKEIAKYRGTSKTRKFN